MPWGEFWTIIAQLVIGFVFFIIAATFVIAAIIVASNVVNDRDSKAQREDL